MVLLGVAGEVQAQTVTLRSLLFESEQATLRLHGGATAVRVLPAATGGSSPYTYTLSTLPAGLAFNANTRTIAGILATVQSVTTTNMTYSAEDSAGISGMQTFDISVAAPLEFASTVPATVALPRNAAASETLPALSGGYTPYAYTLDGSALPAGLAFNASTRVLSGTPSAIADINITYIAKDAAGTDGERGGILTSAIRIRVLEFDMDVDDSGGVTAQDGIMIARHLLGADAASVRAGQSNTAAATIAGNIQDGVDLGMLNVDADSDTDGNDGIMVLRYMLGLRGKALVAGMGNAVAATVEANVAALLP